MSGVVHFKFRSAISYDNVVFDGHFITVYELKRLIADKKGLGKEAGADLVLSDPRSNKEYIDDSFQVPKNTSVLVRRVAASKHKTIQSNIDVTIRSNVTAPQPQDAGVGDAEDDGDDFGADPYQAAAAQAQYDQENAILSNIVDGIGKDYETSLRSGGRGRGRGGRGRGLPGHGAPGAGFRCHRCGEYGHHMSECPKKDDPEFSMKRVKKSYGIPSTLLARNQEGGLVLPNGELGAVRENQNVFHKELAYLAGMQHKQESSPEPQAYQEDIKQQQPMYNQQGASASLNQEAALMHRAQSMHPMQEPRMAMAPPQTRPSQPNENLHRLLSDALVDDDDFAPPKPLASVELGFGMDTALNATMDRNRGPERPQPQPMDRRDPEPSMQMGGPMPTMSEMPGIMPGVGQDGERLQPSPPIPRSPPRLPDDVAADLIHLRDILPHAPVKFLLEGFFRQEPLMFSEYAQLQRMMRGGEPAPEGAGWERGQNGASKAHAGYEGGPSRSSRDQELGQREGFQDRTDFQRRHDGGYEGGREAARPQGLRSGEEGSRRYGGDASGPHRGYGEGAGRRHGAAADGYRYAADDVDDRCCNVRFQTCILHASAA